MSKVVSVIVVKAGGTKKLVDLAEGKATLGELRSQESIPSNMLATVNGDTEESSDFELEEGAYVTFTEQVKGA